MGAQPQRVEHRRIDLVDGAVGGDLDDGVVRALTRAACRRSARSPVPRPRCPRPARAIAFGSSRLAYASDSLTARIVSNATRRDVVRGAHRAEPRASVGVAAAAPPVRGVHRRSCRRAARARARSVRSRSRRAARVRAARARRRRGAGRRRLRGAAERIFTRAPSMRGVRSRLGRDAADARQDRVALVAPADAAVVVAELRRERRSRPLRARRPPCRRRSCRRPRRAGRRPRRPAPRARRLRSPSRNRVSPLGEDVAGIEGRRRVGTPRRRSPRRRRSARAAPAPRRASAAAARSAG